MSRNKEESRKTPLTSWHPQHSPQTGKGRTRHRQGVTELWYTPDGHLANQGVQESDAEQDEQESDDVRNLSPVEVGVIGSMLAEIVESLR